LVYQTEKFLADNDDKLPQEGKDNVKEPLDELKKALEGNDSDAIKAAAEKVATASSAVGAALYQEQASAGEAGGAPGGDAGASNSDDDEVVDAEIVDEDDKK
jgi:molecular chaperone DnaK